MKRRDFEGWLRSHGAVRARHGATHDVWARGPLQASVPRHKEIKDGTARAICKQLDVPKP